MSYNLSYSSMADIYAIAEDETGGTKKALLVLADDLEKTGVGYFEGTEYVLRDSAYGMEVVSMEDFQSENEEEDDDF